MMYTPSKQLTFVVYEDQTPTKCFEVRKGHLRLLLLSLAAVILTALVAIFFVYAYVTNVTGALKEQEPILLKKYQSEHEQLLTNIEELQKSRKDLEELNASLLNKLKSARSAAPSAANQGSGNNNHTNAFALIAPPAVGDDLSPQELLSIDSFKLKYQSGVLTANFNLLSSKDKKITGYVFVLLKSKSAYIIYPSSGTIKKNSLAYDYDSGESFSVSRLRPVNASFHWPTERSGSVNLEIIVFSREGDLLLRKLMGPLSLSGAQL
ncbi:MAG: hypothetical protein HQK50_06880 [Oligoflexia bacterium]|nr:hypothetical protein [Oligoflexia bacterium]MBF0365278.1 hypothetical protein [Oligoflexia bacterium]